MHFLMFKYIFGIDKSVPIDEGLVLKRSLLQGCLLGSIFLEAIVFLVDPYY